MHNVFAIAYSVTTFFFTVGHFSRVGHPGLGYTVAVLFAYVVFVMTQAMLLGYNKTPREPVEHLGMHARLVISILAPFLVATILTRVLYVGTGMPKTGAVLLMFAPWMYLNAWTQAFLFPQEEDGPPTGIFMCFIPTQLRGGR